MKANCVYFSVIVPVYNVDNYLVQCIDSILFQTYSNFELLLIDDGSTDSSSYICNKYAKKDSRVRVFHKDNGGVSSARNRGIEESKGDYIVFIDADDWIDNDYLQCLMPNEKDDIVCCSYKLENITKEINDWGILLSESSNSTDFITNNITKFGFNTVWAKVFRSDIIKQKHIRFNENISQCEDAIFVFDYLCTYKCNIKNVLRQSYHYRWDYRPRNIFRNFPVHESFILFKLIPERLDKIIDLYNCPDVTYAKNELVFSQIYNVCHNIIENKCMVKNKISNIFELLRSKTVEETLTDKDYMKLKRNGLLLYYLVSVYYMFRRFFIGCIVNR
jgi:glycosyltransferase involved in cell wall biosynthesis